VSTRFDEYRDTYRSEVEKSISFIGRDLTFFTEVKARVLVELVQRETGRAEDAHVLDVGCGPGETDTFLVGRFGSIEGVDISDGVIEAARARNPTVSYEVYDGDRLPYADGVFDLAFAMNVVHHVPPAHWETFTRELARVVRPNGLLALIEHNPFNPLTRLAVSRCEFDDDAVLLRRAQAEGLLRSVGLELASSRYILFFPWRSRALASVEDKLRHLPLGAQYVVAGRRRG
jgi:SAM-dependent methyltransferase